MHNRYLCMFGMYILFTYNVTLFYTCLQPLFLRTSWTIVLLISSALWGLSALLMTPQQVTIFLAFSWILVFLLIALYALLMYRHSTQFTAQFKFVTKQLHRYFAHFIY